MRSANAIAALCRTPTLAKLYLVEGSNLKVIFQYVARPWRLEDTSMEPTFHDGDVVLTTSLNSKLQKDDIVILKDPFRPDQRICKRVIGETVFA